MQKYICVPCTYVYDPEEGDIDNGVYPDTAFEDIPDDFLNSIRKDVTPRIYNIMLELVNRDREDLAEHVLKIDYLIREKLI